MKINIQELITIQEEVNQVVGEKLDRDLTSDDYILAFNVELFEYFNEVGTWKWWKHSHKVDRENILDELADCFAFFLSTVSQQNNVQLFENKEPITAQVEEEVQEVFDMLIKYKEDSGLDSYEVINDLITYVGTDNEVDGVLTIERFAIAIYVATLLFEGITWEEITEAYRKKSNVNIERQNGGY